MITLRVYDRQVRVESTSTYLKDQADQVIDKVTSAQPEGVFWMKKNNPRLQHWDGYIRLYKNDQFPIGLLSRVTKALRTADIPSFTLVDESVIKAIEVNWEALNPDMLHGITLRPYQIEAIKTLAEKVRGVAGMATNSGKTAVLAGLINIIDHSCLVVVNSKDLLYQTAEKINSYLNADICGLLGDSHRDVHSDVVIATIQTLHPYIEQHGLADFEKFKAIFIDECHHVKADNMFDTLLKLPGVFRFGFSGTPLSHKKLDDLKLIAATGEVIVKVSNAEMIEKGVSVEPLVKIYPMNQKDSLKNEKYQDAYQQGIVRNTRRNEVIVQIAKQAVEQGQVVLIIVSHIEHGEVLQRELHKEFVYTQFVHGSSAMTIRKAVMGDMREGRPGAYIATPIFDEGIDISGIETLVLAGGGKSDKKLLQRVGRGLRADKGKELVTIIDFYDDCSPFLRDHSKKRIKVYQQEDFEIEVIK